MKTILITAVMVVIMLTIAVALLGVKSLLIKGGRFSPGHAHDLPRLRRQALERLKQNKNSK